MGMLGSGDTVERSVYRAVLALLRPAESAARRVIAIAAKDIVPKPVARRTAPVAPIPVGSGGRIPCFMLIDPRLKVGPPTKIVGGFGPNVRDFDGRSAAPPAAMQQAPEVSSTRLWRRLNALRHALETVPKQALRLARATLKKERPLRVMRPGRPPGHRAQRIHLVDEVLADCHALALIALAEVEQRAS